MAGVIGGVRISEASPMAEPAPAEPGAQPPEPPPPAPAAAEPVDGSTPALAARALETHPSRAALAQSVAAVALAAAHARNASFGRGGETIELTPEQAETPLGNVARILEQGAGAPEHRSLLAALVALGVNGDPASARSLDWLSAHTEISPLLALDAAGGAALWSEVARVAIDPHTHDFARLEAVCATAALGASGSEVAQRALAEVAERATDPLVRAAAARDAQSSRLVGEITPAPRGPVATFLLAVTGILLVMHVGRLIGRFALAYRRPAGVRLSERGLEVAQRTELLGRVLSDRELLVPFDNLARVTREVRYPRLGWYAGLVALALGSYLGLGLLVDGVRVPGGSPPLLGLGLLLIALGIGIDFALTTLSDGVRGRVRLVVEPRKGRRLCIGRLEPRAADRMLAAIAAQTRT